MYWRWTILFALINIAIPKVGGPNPYSRLASLATLAEEASFDISDLIDKFNWTNDWAEGQNGQKVSNKAPGPVFLAFPVYFFLDKIETFSASDRNERYQQRWKWKHLNGHILSLLLQVFLTAVLVFFINKMFLNKGIGVLTREVFVVGVYFASLSSLFMNSFFGHALAATLVLGSFYFYVRGQLFWTGFWLGLSVLTDYSAALFVVLLLLLLFLQRKMTLKDLCSFSGGALLPFSFWCWYHYSNFGSIVSLPLAHQNPDFVSEASSEGLQGVFKSLPNLDVLLKLLFGFGRGLLMTSPWILLTLYLLTKKIFMKQIPLFKKQNLATALLFFLGLLILNSAFGAWEAGSSPGARYLAIAFPLLLFVLLLDGDLSSREIYWMRWLMLPSLVFFAAVYATTLLLPSGNLWGELMSRLFNGAKWSPLLRFFVIILGLLLAYLHPKKVRRV